MSRSVRVLLAMLVGAGLFGALGVLLSWDDGSELRAELAAEFDGAYPVEPAGGGETVEIDLVAAQSVVELTDGTQTEVWAYNGTVPGPALRVVLGDTLEISVTNDLAAPTTVHWHGIRVPNDMDGVPEINQPKIEPGETFTYTFTPPDAGTFWYHSHVDGSEQLERGLYGSLVVEEAPSDETFDHDQVWVIDDWLLDAEGQLIEVFNTPNEQSQNGRWGNLVTVNASTAESLEVRPNETVRLRLINASNGRVYQPDFGELEATVISVDGLRVGAAFEPADLRLAPGNRIDLMITAPSEPGEYPVSDAYRQVGQPLASLAVLGEAVDESALVPAVNDDVPTWDGALEAPVDHELVFETEKVGDEWIWTINGDAFPDYEALNLVEGEFAKIRLVSSNHPIHPIHLHGQFFKVLTRNGEPVDEPYFRDTVLLESQDEVEIGLVPLDVGTWVLHCHIQEHAEAGMMTVMEVAPADG